MQVQYSVLTVCFVQYMYQRVGRLSMYRDMALTLILLHVHCISTSNALTDFSSNLLVSIAFGIQDKNCNCPSMNLPIVYFPRESHGIAYIEHGKRKLCIQNGPEHGQLYVLTTLQLCLGSVTTKLPGPLVYT